MAELPTVSALWIGGSLTWLEQLCLKSYVDAGQPVALYTYEGVSGVPEGVDVRDANKILEGAKLYRHGRTGSVALFSDLFRFHLMQKAPGEIWIDTDIYCWKPLDVGQPHVFGYETKRQLNGAVLGLPPDSDALGQLLDFTQEEYPIPDFVSPKLKTEYIERAEAGDPVHVSEMPWGVWGPLGVTYYLNKTGEAKYAKPVDVFYPIHYRDRNLFFKRPMRVVSALSEDTLTLHLWARIKKFAGVMYGGYAPKGSFLLSLLEKHEIDQTKGRIVSHGKLEFDHTEFDNETKMAC